MSRYSSRRASAEQEHAESPLQRRPEAPLLSTRLDVTNESGQVPLLINRDAILLRTSKETLERKPGGANSSYTVPPGAHRQVNVRFGVATLAPGESLQLILDQAFTPATGGDRIPVPALALVKR